MTASKELSTRPGWPRRLAEAAIAITAIGLVAACLAPHLPVWPLVLVGHFRVQCAAGGLILVGCAAALRARGWFDIAAAATLIQVVVLAADLGATPAAIPAGGVAIRVLVLNVHTESSRFDEVRRLIADEAPDVVGLIEVDDRWLAALAPALVAYPSRLERPRGDNFGVALYARGAVVGAIELLDGELPSVVAEVTLGDARLGVMVIHPIPPVSAAALAAQRQALAAVAARARTLRSPLVILGDFNATPWSEPFHRLVADTGLCDSRAGFGVQPSFPAGSAILRIPIDHLLASCEIGVRDRRVERDVGSDHLPVIVDLVVPRPGR
jgi:endonuclease/exonuclease/phosphatase (EEP) superfamily protein YafD